MKKSLAALITVPFCVATGYAAALGTSFTYQGRLNDGGNPANGTYDLRFILYTAESGGSQIGNTLTNDNVNVSSGVFVSTVDFGSGIFDGTASWLEVAVRPGTNSGSFTPLDPRQPLTSAPNSIFALSASIATTANSVASGSIDSIALAAGAVVNGNLAANAVTTAKISDGAVLAEILDDDGPGSGLNADLFDGLDSTAFASTSHVHYSQSWTGAAFRGFTVTTSQTGGGVAALRGVIGSGTGFTLGGPVGVWGDSESGTGVLGFTSSTNSAVSAVFGSAVATNGLTRGVRGSSSSTSGWGVYGHASATSGFTRGVSGEADSPDGVGVFGYHDDPAGTGAGVEGVTDSTSASAFGVLGRVTSTSPGPNSAAVRGINNGTTGSGIGVWGSQNGSGYGVYGQAVSGVGVRARSTSGNPIEAYGSSDLDREFYVSSTGSVFADGPYSGAGADFAEMLPARDGLEPGDVLVIGEDGQLTRSSLPHQESVVGVYSTKPGFLGGAGDDADLIGKIPLAIIGVVPVKVTNENGPIKPGNLLTSSSTAGHAMKAAANAPNGTVIGKALATFNGESGAIQMLVLLQ
jgi:hypothetical protein